MVSILAILGLITGFLSGLLGIGGGIVMAPLLLYVPPLFGLEPLTMQCVAGLTIVQGLASCLAGALTHHRMRFVSRPLALTMGSTIFVCAALGGASSKLVANTTLLFLFACLAFTASACMLLPTPQDRTSANLNNFTFRRGRAVAVAAGVGMLGGLVGQGGSFILIPLMTAVVGVPTRIAIGSNLAIVLLSCLAGLISKAATGQIAWPLTLPLLATVIPATIAGGLVSGRMPVLMLRRILAVVVALAAARIVIGLGSY